MNLNHIPATVESGMTFGKAWAIGLIHAANRKAVDETFHKSRGVSTRAMKRSQMTRAERTFKYADVLRNHFHGVI